MVYYFFCWNVPCLFLSESIVITHLVSIHNSNWAQYLTSDLCGQLSWELSTKTIIFKSVCYIIRRTALIAWVFLFVTFSGCRMFVSQVKYTFGFIYFGRLHHFYNSKYLWVLHLSALAVPINMETVFVDSAFPGA